MKEIPILFNGEMVRAILEGRKTQTRRLIKDRPNFESAIEAGAHMQDTAVYLGAGHLTCGGYGWCVDPFRRCLAIKCGSGYAWTTPEVKSPFGKPGDVLWVREAFSNYWRGEDTNDQRLQCTHYRASWDGSLADDPPWTPSIHMPKSACRLRLRVKRVWVERVQDISEDDARKEGATLTCMSPDGTDNGRYIYDFGYIWDAIYGNWKENPWVWACEFEVMK